MSIKPPTAITLMLMVAAFLLLCRPALAVPELASQTGQPCTACHIGGYGPQLTPLGRAFKIGGYTQSGGEGLAASILLSAMVLNVVHPYQQQRPRRSDHALCQQQQLCARPDQLFSRGRVSDHTGGFVQFTYSDIPNAVNLDNTDLRPYTTTFDLGDSELRVGTTVNNNPTVQDPYNSTFAWGFPFVSSGLAPTPAATPILDGGFAGNSIGYTVYAWYDHSLYLEAGGYTTLSHMVVGQARQRPRPRQYPGRDALSARGI